VAEIFAWKCLGWRGEHKGQKAQRQYGRNRFFRDFVLLMPLCGHDEQSGWLLAMLPATDRNRLGSSRAMFEY